ncbi:sensor histidine kinase [Parasphingorhabdus pacifica]
MRSRLLAIVLFLVVLVVLGLGIPLTFSVASSEHQRLFLDRLTVTERLASLAQRPLLESQLDGLNQVLGRYQKVHGIGAAVVDQDGRLGAWTATESQLGDADVRSKINTALAGRRPESVGWLSPWEDKPLVLAVPVLADGEVRGAVVTISPTIQFRQRVLVWWSVILAGGVLALGLAILLALPVSRWILRPIRRLDEATGRVAATVSGGAPFTPVAADTGPAELRKLVRSFDYMAASVSDVLAAQRAFIADASHQLRNPLTALQIRLSNLEHGIEPAAADDYTAAVAETQRLNQILEELLAIARAESASSEPVVTDAGAIVRERVDTWRAAAAARDVQLSLDAPSGELLVSAVSRAVDGVLDALIDNALKFSAESPGVGQNVVEVAARQQWNTVVISVRDHGPGLEPAEVARAADRFWRSPSHQNVSGSGLGLAIVQRIVERSSGTLRLELPDDGGLRVLIELPRAG